MPHLTDEIRAAYPEIDDTVFDERIIVVQDDSDGLGAFIAKWDYSKPIPKGMKLGK